MMQVPTLQPQTSVAPMYNAVKIDVNNPQLTAPGAVSQPVAQPSAYDMPKASVYEVPKQSVYNPNQNFNQPVSVPVAPQPVVVTPNNQPPTEAKPVDAKPADTKPTDAAPADAKPVDAKPAEAKTVETKTPEASAPKVDVNEFITKLTSANYDEQAAVMESIADMAQNSPQKATELLDTRVIDALATIMNNDSSKLAGPTPKQLEIREKIINNKPVTEAENKEANVITPMEQSERNKQYAMYTTAILQKLYSSEIQKLNNTTVPLTELPGAAGIVEQVKKNPNPMVRASAVDSLSYIQAPEYKQDLQTIFSTAAKDKDPIVKQTATKALERLNKMEAPAATAEAKKA